MLQQSLVFVAIKQCQMVVQVFSWSLLFDFTEDRPAVNLIKFLLQSDYNAYQGSDLSPCFHILCYPQPLTDSGASTGLRCPAARHTLV